MIRVYLSSLPMTRYTHFLSKPLLLFIYFYPPTGIPPNEKHPEDAERNALHCLGMISTMSDAHAKSQVRRPSITLTVITHSLLLPSLSHSRGSSAINHSLLPHSFMYAWLPPSRQYSCTHASIITFPVAITHSSLSLSFSVSHPPNRSLLTHYYPPVT